MYIGHYTGHPALSADYCPPLPPRARPPNTKPPSRKHTYIHARAMAVSRPRAATHLVTCDPSHTLSKMILQLAARAQVDT